MLRKQYGGRSHEVRDYIKSTVHELGETFGTDFGTEFEVLALTYVLLLNKGEEDSATYSK